MVKIKLRLVNQTDCRSCGREPFSYAAWVNNKGSLMARCRVSGFRPVFAFLLLTPETLNLSASVQFSCNPSKVEESLLFPKLNTGVCNSDHQLGV
ncbi:MAG: hypothetical protein V2J65_00360 [Desulfobacteraceae bacterium]|nr:hypothetical protein [Desulfobacteraceae bacterium]